MSSSKNLKSNNFVDFINHLLTFNKQIELLKTKQPEKTKNIPFRFNISVNVIIKFNDGVT